MPIHVWIGQFQIDLNVCHLCIRSHENQVIFMWSVSHKHSIWKKEANSNSEVEDKSAYEPIPVL